MRRRQIASTIVIGKSTVIREGIATILRAANFLPLMSISGLDDLPADKVQPQELLALIVHTGHDFDVVLQQIELLRDRYPSACVAVIADQYRLGDMLSAFLRGARGYFVHDMARDVFIKSSELVMMGQTIFPAAFISFVFGKEEPRIKSGDAMHFTKADRNTQELSPREKITLQYLIEGNSNKSIARKMKIAEATVKVHIHSILHKARVQNRTQAVIWWMNNWLLVRPTNDGSSIAAADMTKRPSNSSETVCDNKQIDGSRPITVPTLLMPRMSRMFRRD